MNSSTKLIANFINYIFCVSTQRITQSVPNFTTSWYLALEIYADNINILHIITILWYFYYILCKSIANEFIHICHYLALNDASFSISQCSELQAITSLTKIHSLCFLNSGLYLCWILSVITDILCPLLRCSIRIKFSCLASLLQSSLL